MWLKHVEDSRFRFGNIFSVVAQASNISLKAELGMMSVKLESFCSVTHDMESR